MNRKHTPGPWRRHEKTEGCDSGTVLAGYNKIVALVSDRPEQEANARLIAQVPELLLIAIAYRNLLKTMAACGYAAQTERGAYCVGPSMVEMGWANRLLAELFQSTGRVLTRDRLLNSVWGYEFEGYARTVDTHIRRLRQKLGACARMIDTVRGVGYRFKE